MSDRLHLCSACPKFHPPIPGDGPVPCSIMVIGEGPARRELEGQKRDPHGLGRPLVGDSGQEYNQYLQLAGLERESVYTTNISKCTDKALSNPSMEQAETCAEFHLHSELRAVQPSVIITLGAIALHTLFPGHELEMEHGLPFRGEWGAWRGIVIPMYHPAAGLHGGGRFMSMMRDDWAKLAGIEEFGSLRKSDEYPGPDYRECSTSKDVERYMDAWDGHDLAMDTEVYNLRTMKPYCMSFSHRPGTGRVIRAESRDALRQLNNYIQKRGRVILHNAGFDPRVLAEMGIVVPPDRFDDTMMMAYHIGYLSQSLKVLAYRLCGMVMEEFQDVAGPPSKRVVMDWLYNAYDKLHSPPCYVPETEFAGDTMQMITADFFPYPPDMKKTVRMKLWKEVLAGLGNDLLVYRGAPITCRPEDAEYLPSFVKTVNSLKTGNEKTVQRIQSLLSALLDDPGSTDPWSRFDDWNDDVRNRIVAAAGPMPELSITHVPWDKALYYSARDADATIRILPIIRRLHRGWGGETL